MIAALALIVTLATAGAVPKPVGAQVHADMAATPPASSAAGATDTTVTRIFLVRHADKNTDWVGDDPPLSPSGRERAHALAHVLSDAHVDLIYCSYFLRARATAESVAVMAHDSIQVVDQAHPEALAARLWSEGRGRTVLIVGHSDTVPQLVHALCPAAAAELGPVGYDRLFLVTRRGSGPAALVQLRYGAP